MSRSKKDGKHLNVVLHKDLCEQFEAFCERMGQSKTVATERAIAAYMTAMKAAMSRPNTQSANSSQTTVH